MVLEKQKKEEEAKGIFRINGDFHDYYEELDVLG